MKILVGYTGFVGSNIYKYGDFDKVYNSKNIKDAYGTNPDLLVYAGMRAEKYLANNYPKKDYELILEAEENIKKINPKKIVLISTVDVIKDTDNFDEDSTIDTKDLQAYGLNRYKLEEFVQENFKDNYLIIRLPALFGENIKKNFIFDLINIIPFMLTEEKINEIGKDHKDVFEYYEKLDNGFYRVIPLDNSQKNYLKNLFLEAGFSALNFTDSRNIYQFYPLKRLYKDIMTCLDNGIELWHPATYPVSARELYRYVKDEDFVNEIAKSPVKYNFKTKYASVFNGKDGYIMDKREVLEELKSFINENN